MVKKLSIRHWIGPVINSLREGPKQWSDLMQTIHKQSDGKTVKISVGTLDRILKDYLEYWGLVQKKEDCWIWYEYKDEFSAAEHQLRLEHSKHLLLSIFGRLDEFMRLGQKSVNTDEIYMVDPYDMLDWIVFCDLIRPPEMLPVNPDITCLRQHLRTGPSYRNINLEMEQYRKEMEKIGGPFYHEDFPCESPRVEHDPSWTPKLEITWVKPAQSLPKNCEDLKISLGHELFDLNHRVQQHGILLEGTCDICKTFPTIKG
jgi:hypothetical protein